jgi:hypothetical protein
MKISQPQTLKRKLPSFIMSNESKKVIKVVRFNDEIDDLGYSSLNQTQDSLESIPEGTQDAMVECGETNELPSDEEHLKLEQMHCVVSNLNKELTERRRSVRLDSGEIMEGRTPPSSQESNCSWEFELAYSSATDDVGPDDIFDFIWNNVSDLDSDIYRRIGQKTRETAEYYLRNAPRDLLSILESALAEAERKVNQFSV